MQIFRYHKNFVLMTICISARRDYSAECRGARDGRRPAKCEENNPQIANYSFVTAELLSCNVHWRRAIRSYVTWCFLNALTARGVSTTSMKAYKIVSTVGRSATKGPAAYDTM